MKTTKKFKFSPGDKVEEKVTGFKGIITGAAFYLTGCNTYCIVPKSKNGMSAEGSWYDEDRLKLIKSSVIKTKDVTGDKNGSDIMPDKSS